VRTVKITVDGVLRVHLSMLVHVFPLNLVLLLCRCCRDVMQIITTWIAAKSFQIVPVAKIIKIIVDGVVQELDPM